MVSLGKRDAAFRANKKVFLVNHTFLFWMTGMLCSETKHNKYDIFYLPTSSKADYITLG